MALQELAILLEVQCLQGEASILEVRRRPLTEAEGAIPPEDAAAIRLLQMARPYHLA